LNRRELFQIGADDLPATFDSLVHVQTEVLNDLKFIIASQWKSYISRLTSGMQCMPSNFVTREAGGRKCQGGQRWSVRVAFSWMRWTVGAGALEQIIILT
jgi:hypothetical protein